MGGREDRRKGRGGGVADQKEEEEGKEGAPKKLMLETVLVEKK